MGVERTTKGSQIKVLLSDLLEDIMVGLETFGSDSSTESDSNTAAPLSDKKENESVLKLPLIPSQGQKMVFDQQGRCLSCGAPGSVWCEYCGSNKPK